MRLSQNDDAVVYNEQATIEFSVPMNTPPSGVFRHGTNHGAPDAPTAASALRAVASRAELAANPLGTYFYDATSRLVVSGREDLGDGMTAGFHLEHGILADTGAAVSIVRWASWVPL